MTCYKPHVTTLVATAMTFLAFILDLIGLVAPAWFYVRLGEKGEARVGLWDYCYSLPRYDCETVSEQFPVYAWLQASRAFALLGFLSLCLCVASCICLFFASHLTIFFTITPISCLVSTAFVFLEFAVFSGSVERVRNRMGQYFRYDYAFAVTVTAFILLVPACVLHVTGHLKAADSPELQQLVESARRAKAAKAPRGEQAFDSDMAAGEVRVGAESSWGHSDRRSRERDLNRSRDSDYSQRDLNRSRQNAASREGYAEREFDKSFDRQSNV